MPHSPPARAPFASTRWSLVLAARGGEGSAARRALGELCALYWRPVYCFLRTKGHGPDDAMDLTQGFIAGLLEKGNLGAPDATLGRFRQFLLGAVNHHVANVDRRARAAKRGGGVAMLSLDAAAAEQQLAREPADHRTPESVYIRQWALTLLDDTVAALRARYDREGKAVLFEKLRPFITGGRGESRYREVGEALGMTEDAVKMAVSRLRKRYREELRARVAETVADPRDVDDELRGLIDALR